MTENADILGLHPLRTRVSPCPAFDLYFIQACSNDGSRNSLIQEASMSAKKVKQRITAGKIREVKEVDILLTLK